jgi:phosphoribosylanthranilate isomerase
MKPRVKICGLVRADDVDLAVDLGATHLGFVLAADSPRALTADAAVALAARARGAQPVLVFRRSDAAHVLACVARTGVRCVQLPAAEERTCALVAASGVRVHRAHAVARGTLPALRPTPDEREPALLDVGDGGTGRRFDWTLLGDEAPAHTFVAGGITPDNLPSLLAHRPWGIDLSSGIEEAPGKKDHARLRRLFAALEQHR